MKNVYTKLILPTILSVMLFVLTIFIVIIPRYKQNIMNGKREMIRELTNSALSILSKYENDEREGLLTREEAQSIAISRIQYLRYGEENKDYFWITDMTPVMIMHPFRNDLNGKDLTNFSDPHGNKLFVEFVETVRKSEQGYVNYMWQWKDDSSIIVPKLSYVEIFKPWDWVIGTGIYIEDVKKEISSLMNRVIWILIAISILIAALLFYIIKQSLGFERKRAQAENELQRSKDKLRTLVEAATEGLIMLIDGKISYSNNVMSKMTGFDCDELRNLPITEIISRNSNKEVIEAFSENIVREGKFELSLRRKNRGYTDVLVTSSTTSFYGKSVNIILIKEISTDKALLANNINYQKLVSHLDLGVFKARIDGDGKFIYANEKAIKILGFDSFEELSSVHFLRLIYDSDERKLLRKLVAEKGALSNEIFKIIKKNGDHSIIALSLVLLNEENARDLICDGIIEDITIIENERKQTSDLISELKTSDFLLEQSVKNFIVPAITLDGDATIKEALRMLTLNKTDSLLITGNGKAIMGIITSTDIQNRIFTLNLSTDNPAYMIMSSPVKYITQSTSVLDALIISGEYKINHLVVRDDGNEITGVLRIHKIHEEIRSSLSFYIGKVMKAGTDLEIKQCYVSMRKLVIPLIRSEIGIRYITNVTTSFSDAVTKRIIALALEENGMPPARFAFICMGSEGRKEETLFTDQDNAIIYEDVPKEKENAASDYFLKLGERISDSLNFTGYTYCAGNIMSKNIKWCKPLKEWEKYFADWISAPEPQNLLDASVFFDFRTVYGDETFAETLTETISASIGKNPLFLYHLAYNTVHAKAQHISSGSILSEKHADVLDLKSTVVPFIMFARTYALKNNYRYANTIERLTAMRGEDVYSESIMNEIIYAYNFLMKLRFRNQADLLSKNMPLSNSMNTVSLIDTELHLLKKVLSVIPDFQALIKADFRVTSQ